MSLQMVFLGKKALIILDKMPQVIIMMLQTFSSLKQDEKEKNEIFLKQNYFSFRPTNL